MKLVKQNDGWLMWPETKEEREATNQIAEEMLRYKERPLTIGYSYLPSGPTLKMDSPYCIGLHVRK